MSLVGGCGGAAFAAAIGPVARQTPASLSQCVPSFLHSFDCVAVMSLFSGTLFFLSPFFAAAHTATFALIRQSIRFDPDQAS